jgi:hypothetical protein
MKCIFKGNTNTSHCDDPADYVYLGKSYCAYHLEIRAKEANSPETLHSQEDESKPIQEKMREEFMECSLCSAQSGSPYLCESCLHNRAIISKFSSFKAILLKRVGEKLKEAGEGKPADAYERGYDHGIWQAEMIVKQIIKEL